MRDYEILDSIMSELENGSYDGQNDLLPWQFDSEEITPLECLVLVRAWHHIGKVWSFGCSHNECVKCGYTYIVEYQKVIYRIEITENMGLWSIEQIANLEN